MIINWLSTVTRKGPLHTTQHTLSSYDMNRVALSCCMLCDDYDQTNTNPMYYIIYINQQNSINYEDVHPPPVDRDLLNAQCMVLTSLYHFNFLVSARYAMLIESRMWGLLWSDQKSSVKQFLIKGRWLCDHNWLKTGYSNRDTLTQVPGKLRDKFDPLIRSSADGCLIITCLETLNDTSAIRLGMWMRWYLDQILLAVKKSQTNQNSGDLVFSNFWSKHEHLLTYQCYGGQEEVRPTKEGGDVASSHCGSVGSATSRPTPQTTTVGGSGQLWWWYQTGRDQSRYPSPCQIRQPSQITLDVKVWSIHSAQLWFVYVQLSWCETEVEKRESLGMVYTT